MPGKPSPDQQCTATSKRTGVRCGAWKMRGKSVCKNHGGKSLAGVNSPRWRDGSRSRLTAVLSGANSASLEQALADPQYVEMRQEMAYLRVAWLDAAERAQLGRASELWETLECQWKLWETLECQWKLFATPGPQEAPERSSAALKEMGRVIRDGVAGHRAQEEALGIIERTRKLADTERRGPKEGDS